MLKFGSLQAAVLLLLFAAFLSVQAQISSMEPDCGENAEWSWCASACPATCNETSSSRPCTLQCVFACQCRPGYVRNEQQQCVDPNEC